VNEAGVDVVTRARSRCRDESRPVHQDWMECDACCDCASFYCSDMMDCNAASSDALKAFQWKGTRLAMNI